MMTQPATTGPLVRDLVQVVLSGDLPERVRGWAVAEVEQHLTPGRLPLLDGRVTIRSPARPAQPCRADIAVNLDGHLIHGRADAASPRDALRLAAERVQRQARSITERPAGL
jgi:ribosome-associated translation inhibitor RaiA